ncbi:hypothetical protein LFU01_33700 [Lysinibacillus fusiformis]|nr:hypothetical protein LFU01_33700 [Lysinibacillus fusiformis]
MDIPIKPIYLLRVSSLDISAINPVTAVYKAPENNPPTTRETYKIAKLSINNEKITKLRLKPISPV